MFRKLANLFLKQQAPAKEVEVPLSIKENTSLKKTDKHRSGVFKPGRPISKQPPPNQPGHYRIVRKKTGELRYIGVAQDLLRRKANHHKSQKKLKPSLDVFLWQPAKDGVSADELYEYEKTKIKKHKPRLNRNGGGGGRRPAKPTSPVCETATPVAIERITLKKV